MKTMLAYALTLFVLMVNQGQTSSFTEEDIVQMLREEAARFQAFELGVFVTATVNIQLNPAEEDLKKARDEARGQRGGMHYIDSQIFTITEYYSTSHFYQIRSGSNTLFSPTSEDDDTRYSIHEEKIVYMDEEKVLNHSSRIPSISIKAREQENPLMELHDYSLVRMLRNVQNDDFRQIYSSVKEGNHVLGEIEALEGDTVRFDLYTNPIKAGPPWKYTAQKQGDGKYRIISCQWRYTENLDVWKKFFEYNDNGVLQKVKTIQYQVSPKKGMQPSDLATHSGNLDEVLQSRKSTETSASITFFSCPAQNRETFDSILDHFPNGTWISDSIEEVSHIKGDPDSLETFAEIEERTERLRREGRLPTLPAAEPENEQ